MTQSSQQQESEQKYYPRAESLHQEDDNLLTMQGDTLWENPTDRDVILPLHIGSTQMMGKGRPNPTQKSGIDYKRIPAHSTVAISRDFDIAIQDTHCNEPECVGDRRGCRRTDHNKTVVGGYGPQLVNKGMKVRPGVHSALDSHQAELNRVMSSLKETELATLQLERERKAAQSELEKLRQEIEAAKAAKAETASVVSLPKNKG